MIHAIEFYSQLKDDIGNQTQSDETNSDTDDSVVVVVVVVVGFIDDVSGHLAHAS